MSNGVYTSVYRTIKKHPKLRKLSRKLEISKAEAIGLLYVVWDYCQEDADQGGTLDEIERVDIEEELVLFSDVPPDKVLDAMFETGWLDNDNGKITIHNWDVWQSEWHKAKERRMKDVDRKRQAREKTDEDPAGEITPVGSGETKKKNTYPEKFEAFWAVYPRKIEKGMAYKKFRARVNAGYTEEQLISAARNYADDCRRNHTEQKYIKHPSTFLGDATPFTDYLQKDILLERLEESVDEGNPFAEDAEKWEKDRAPKQKEG